MLKRIGAFLSALVLSVLVGALPANCAAAGAVETANVKDTLGYLTQDEATSLQAEIESMQQAYSLDAVIVIVDNLDGKTPSAYAEDYYDYNGYGVGEDRSGLALLINMGDRDIAIATSGHAIDIFTDDRIASMISSIGTCLRDEAFYDAGTTFLSDIASYVTAGVPDGQHRVETDRSYIDKVGSMMTNVWVYVIALAVAVIVVIVITLSSGGKVTVDNKTYEEAGAFVLTGSQDDYLREVTTCAKISSDSDGGSGSSTHTGSSGSTHGGGSGKF